MTVDDVKIGQVWRDRDKRMWSGNRIVRIEALIEKTRTIQEDSVDRFAEVRQIIARDHHADRRTTCIRLDNLISRFELLKDSAEKKTT